MYTNCIPVTKHSDEGHKSDRNMLVKTNNMCLNIFINVFLLVIAQVYTILHCTSIHYCPLHKYTLFSVAQAYTTLHCTSIHYCPLHTYTLFSVAQVYSTLHCTHEVHSSLLRLLSAAIPRRRFLLWFISV